MSQKNLLKTSSRRTFLSSSAKSALLLGAGSGLLSLLHINQSEAAALPPALLELQKMLGSKTAQLFISGHQTDQNFRNGFKLRTISQPQALLLPTDFDAIPKAIEWSQKTATPLHFKSGGHSYEGYSSGAGVVVDLQPVNQVQIYGIGSDFCRWRNGRALLF